MKKQSARNPLLPSLLRRRSIELGERSAYVFLLDGEAVGEELSYADLDRRAGIIATAIAERVVPGERALLLFPPGLDFISAFFGCLYAGVVAVPAYPPRPRREQPRLAAIARDATPRLVLTTAAIAARLEASATQLPELEDALWLATDELLDHGLENGVEAFTAFSAAALDPAAPAFLQYTSGSTSTPKGVVVTHRNLVHNEAMIQQAFEQDQNSVVVGWLPLYHDMGLIGNVLQPLYAGARCILMSPMAFLQRPLRWLEAISHYRGTTSGGPNFAYDLCVRKIPEEARGALDLSTWRVAFNGSEPVRAETLERFAQAFGPCGFKRRAFFPCYGLAEGTLFVAGPRRGAATTVATFEESALAEHRVVAAAADSSAGQTLVGCGGPWSGQEIVIVDPSGQQECRSGQVGEIWVAGESVAREYRNRPEESAETFGARLSDKRAPFLRTGDLGFVDEEGSGELFVTGRLKDLIIIRGRNHYPQDLELTAERSHRKLRPDGGGAFSVDLAGEERLVVVHEVERRAKGLEEIAEGVRRAVAEEHEVQVYEVVLILPGSLPKTSSGKVQRHACRKAYLTESLRRLASSRLGEGTFETAAVSAPTELRPEFLLGLDKVERRVVLVSWIGQRMASLVGLGTRPPEPSQPLTSLGLDSLVAVELKGGVEEALGVEVPLAELLGGCSTEEFAEIVARAFETDPGEAAEAEVISATVLGDRPVSPGQAALWFLERMSPEGGAYNIAAAARLPRGVDAAALRRAIERLAARHPVLRTSFHARGGEPVQRLAAGDDPMEVDFALVDGVPGPLLSERLAEEAYRPFDLDRVPLWRWRLFVEGAGEASVLLLAIHHLIADFWSLAVLSRELGALYVEEAGGPEAGLPAPGATYADFVQRQAARLAGGRGRRLWAYWEQQLAGPPKDLDLPTDHPRPPVRSFRGGAHTTVLPPALAAEIWGLARSHQVTLFAVLLAAWQVQLGRATGQRDFAIGTPTSGRRESRYAGTAGYFVNPVVLRADLARESTFLELLSRVQQTVIGALEHAELPLALLAERLEPERDASRSPLFQAMLVLQTARPGDDPGLGAFALGAPGIRIVAGGLDFESVAMAERRAQFELTLWVAPWPGAGGDQGGLGLVLEYNSDLFDATTAGRMVRQFKTLLGALLVTPQGQCSRLPLLTVGERAQLLVEWNERRPRRNLVGGEGACCLHQLFEAQVERTPDALALIAGRERLSYLELNRRSNRLAHHLRSLGVAPEVRVGVCLARSAEMMVSLLAVLKAGGAYVALDPTYPKERLEFLLTDAAALLVVTTASASAALDGAAGLWLDIEEAGAAIAARAEDNPRPTAGPENLAYVLYTSGSTGRPKGVAITHRSPVDLVRWARQIFLPTDLRGVLASTSINFDLSVFELFVPLSWGGRVVLAGNAMELPTLPAKGEVRLVNTVPSAMAELVRGGLLPSSVRTINLAGEPISPALLAALHGEESVARIYNLYGPSEDTTYSTFAHLQPGSGAPIGRPVADTEVYLLDAAGEMVALGVAGELHLGGAGLARGYLGRPRLTAERFVPDPCAAAGGGRLYRTGDLARYRVDGKLDFLGRLDHQVKVRGYRIELGEIESQLVRRPDVREAVVVARDQQLVAYVVLAEGGTTATLGQHLRDRLPAFMVPGTWVALPSLPLNPNGKVDRRALPAPEQVADPSVRLAQTPTEELLAGIFAELLERDQVGVEESFFDLGGHSLLAMRLVSRVREALGVELPVGLVFETPTVAGLAARAEQAQGKGSRRAPITRGDRPVDGSAVFLCDLSFAQERLWFLHHLEPGNATYNLPAAIRLRGALNVPALAAALTAVVRRHEALRTTFETRSRAGHGSAQESAPVQVITRPRWVRAELPRVDLTFLPTGRRRREVDRLARQEARRPFDLCRGPLLRTSLLVLESAAPGEQYVLLLTLHHIICDGWSLGVLGQELGALYGEGSEDLDSPHKLAELPIQYADFAAWQRRRLRPGGEVLEAELAYWKERLGDAPGALELPTDRPRPVVQSFTGASHHYTWSEALSQRLARLSRRLDATRFMTLLAAFQVLLGRYAGTTDVVVGSPVAGRNAAETEGLIGLFVNSLVLRTDLSAEGSRTPEFATVVARVREVTLAAYAHQEVPFEKLVEVLAPQRELAQAPLFQVMFAHQTTPLETLRLGGLALEPLVVESATAKFDLTLFAAPEEKMLSGSWEFNSDLFDRTSVQRLAKHFENFLAAVADDPSQVVGELIFWTPSERQQRLVEWNDTAAILPSSGTPGRVPRAEDLCLHELFEAQVERTPEAPALCTGVEQLTYRQLNRRANQLAHYLRQQGVGPEVRVGVCLARSADMVVSLLAILKAGGAYVAMDPAYPRERLDFLLADSGARWVLTSASAAAPSLPGAEERMLALEHHRDTIAAESELNLEPLATPGNLAYLLYTSGSTGRPKGVAVAHRSPVVLVHWARKVFSATELMGVMAATSINFDLSVFELFVPLSWGGQVVLAENALELSSLAARDQVTLINTVPSAMAELLRAGPLPPSVRTINLAGEPIPPPLVRALRTLVEGPEPLERAYNLYGPSEDTTYSIFTLLRHGAGDSRGEGPPIGRPVAETWAYLVDGAGESVPLGVPGELWLGGKGLARGYMDRPGLTAARFLPDRFSGRAGERIYRTGDLARTRPDGTLDFLGRLDHQVKIRGYRIELGEIEAELGSHPGVREATVMAQMPDGDSEGNPRLVASVVLAEGCAVHDLREHLRQRLPDFMLPSIWRRLAALPLNPNGKVDRAALARLPLPDALPTPWSSAPRTPMEELLAGFFAELLGRPVAGLEESFFELGGHSLLAMRLVSRLRGALGVDLPVKAVFETPTVAALAARLESAKEGERPTRPPIEPVARPEAGAPLSFAQERLWFLHQLEPESPAYNIPLAVHLEGTLEVAALRAALHQVVRRHDSLRTTLTTSTEDGRAEPVQVVSAWQPRALHLSLVDLCRLAGKHREGEVQRLLRQEAKRPFDLTRGPLLRSTLLVLGQDGAALRESLLLVTLHHIVSDGWSLGVLVRELGVLYRAAADGRPSSLPELPLQYADFACWQRRWLASGDTMAEVLPRDLAYWRRQLGEPPPAVELPTDRPRPVVQSFAGGQLSFVLPESLNQRVAGFGRDHDATLFMTLVAAFQLLLCRYSGQTDIAVGTPVAGREAVEVEGLIGLFVNTVVLRTDLTLGEGAVQRAGGPSFPQLVAAVREVTLAAFAHRELPFEKLVEELQPARDLARTPFFQVMFVLQNTPSEVLALQGLKATPRAVGSGTSKFDLTLFISPQEEGWGGVWEYNRDLFDAATVRRMSGHLTHLLGAALQEPQRPMFDLVLLGGSERQQLVAEWNDTACAAEADGCCLHQLFESQVRRSPGALAVRSGELHLTYGALNRRANRLAHRLRHCGVGPEVRVGVFTSRSLQMVVGLLAILKAGGAYVGLDPNYPPERLHFMLEDAEVEVLLTEEGLRKALPNSPAQVIELAPAEPAGECLEENGTGVEAAAEDLEPLATADNLAYLIYTSGSTGRPKGVAIEHRSPVDLMHWARTLFHPSELSGLVAATSICFDLSVFELFVPLSWGGRVVLVDDVLSLAGESSALGPLRLINTVPSAMAELVAGELPPTLTTVNLAGEALPAALVEQIYGHQQVQRVLNLYGPSEDTTYSTGLTIARGAPRVTIGRPLANKRCFLLDRRLRPVPMGVVGEIYLSGAGLARGYLGRPSLTASSFLPDPCSPTGGGRLYKTGDLGRHLCAGEVDFLGRGDQQVKVRGFRIELGEIEAALVGHPGVREAAVVTHQLPAAGQLVAYVVLADGGGLETVPELSGEIPSTTHLQTFLSKKIPRYMVPSNFSFIELLPRLPNGKIDRRALAGREVSEPELEEAFVAPRSPTEEVVAEIWQEVLGTERVGVQDSFFALGGHSLLALRVVSRVEKEFGVRLPLKAMFGANTVEALAAKVDEMLLHEASDERIDELLRLLEEAEGEEDEIDKKASS